MKSKHFRGNSTGKEISAWVDKRLFALVHKKKLQIVFARNRYNIYL